MGLSNYVLSKVFMCILIIFSICSLTMAQNNHNTKYIELNDGRDLCYTVYGDPFGTPFFFFHGFPGSRLDILLFNGDAIAKQKGVKLIAVDRPGYGDSEFQKERTLLDWPKDIAELADTLKIDKFSILGYSGGGPYALACAYQIPERLNKVCVISGMVPKSTTKAKNGSSMFIPKMPPYLQNIILKGMKKMLVDKPERLIQNMNKSLPEPDKKILENETVKIAFINTWSESLKTDHKGAKHDAKIYKKDWGFDISKIKKEVYFYHGEEDLNILSVSAKHLANELQNCNSEFYSKEGHISLIYKYFDQIMTTLIIND